jgi:UDP-N-acetylglucosamine 2-epimerase (non-hydrolysing)
MIQSSPKQFACIVGARPNFMKMAPILRALEQYPHIRTSLIHTGQHYDPNLSGIFFEELGIRPPDVSLEIGSGSHGEQTGRLIEKLERTYLDAASQGNPIDRVIVVGDVNSTMAATLAAAKLGIPVAHVEAGLRSFDRTMPEEINRIVTDSISDLLLVSEPAGIENLLREGHPKEHLHLVGNVMIDTLLRQVSVAKERPILKELKLTPKSYAVVTLHRPSNVDSAESLAALCAVLARVAERMTIVFPVHPRTRKKLQDFGLQSRLANHPGILLLDPLGYNDFLAVTSQARVIVTDSGGLQEESTALGVPCLTMRKNTERPITVDEGTSTLCGEDPLVLEKHFNDVISGAYRIGKCPQLWDGKAASRIAEVLANYR